MSHSPLLLQLIIILGTARLLGAILKFFGQPLVIGEMVAGLALGPAVFGALSPDLHAAVFARSSLPELDALSQLGLVLFMFIVGAGLRLPSGARGQLKAAGWIGVLAVLIPIALGLAIAIPLHPQLAPPGVPLTTFALYMGVAVSITAFPVMARILKDRGETHTTVGRLALTSAAVADVISWVVLALVVIMAGTGKDMSHLWRLLGGVALLLVVLFKIVRPAVAWMLSKYATDGRPAGALLAVLLMGTFASAYTTAAIDVHPVFGAFLFGACLPRDDRLLHSLIERIEHVSILVLMPVFFALAGLNTTPDAFVGAGPGAMLLILAVSVGGKLLGGSIGARIAGQPWRPALAVGSLMNARGLMELIVIKVGLDAGIISRPLFTMLLVMAIVTTMMTGPLLNIFLRPGRSAQSAASVRER
ncbi:MAG TPA: cation:proton antiporter [Steroidobacteraceae bacterium]|nr:cation:proton antiporter [Steroidobacteraceae bacterium]